MVEEIKIKLLDYQTACSSIKCELQLWFFEITNHKAAVEPLIDEFRPKKLLKAIIEPKLNKLISELDDLHESLKKIDFISLIPDVLAGRDNFRRIEDELKWLKSKKESLVKIEYKCNDLFEKFIKDMVDIDKEFPDNDVATPAFRLFRPGGEHSSLQQPVIDSILLPTRQRSDSSGGVVEESTESGSNIESAEEISEQENASSSLS